MKTYFIYPTRLSTFLLFWVSLLLNQYLSASTSALETNHLLLDSKSYLEQEEPFNLTITADHSTFVKTGQVINFTFVVSTTSPTLTFKDVNVTCQLLGWVVLLDQKTVSLNQSATGSGLYLASAEDISQQKIVITALAVGSTESGETFTASASLTLPYVPLNLTKEASPMLFSTIDEKITYTYQVTNLGDENFQSVEIEDDKLGTMKIAPLLEVGKLATLTQTYHVTQSDLDAGEIVNIARASGKNQFEGEVFSNNVTCVVNAQETFDFALAKTAVPAVISTIGEIINYRYDLTNQGNVTLENIVIEDDKISFVNLPVTTLLPRQSLTTTASYVVTESDILQGSITNMTIARGTNMRLNPIQSNSAITTVMVDETQTILPPRDLRGYRTSNQFVNQTDYIDVLQWQIPSAGEVPTGYKIFSDVGLKKLVAKVSGYHITEYRIHNRHKHRSYTYYIVSEDQFGKKSAPISIKIYSKK
ncbi:DUF7507 domain-containing protein [Candidatus Protochlamydia sp. W-9]|uniref:DUF7507 domain-containing protein n=1 Tax=Candidatus Protochlamydia sp. W-9 TaxID=1785087 RepID=UPI00096A7D40|nr:hypothetical protein [Candidatus Protochlamydia sp. W-9]